MFYQNFNYLLIRKINNTKVMAFLTDDSSFTHVIAIDFGTGASGYSISLLI